MTDIGEFIVRSAGLGVGATLFMDLWTWVRQRLFRSPAANYRLVGRWIGHLFRGRFRHSLIAKAAPIRGELAIGWVFHYITGVAFAALLLAVYGLAWAHAPTFMPAVIIGVATVAAPFLIMQPAMGAGFAASRTPQPARARLQSLVTHAVFGVGLYLSAWLMAV